MCQSDVNLVAGIQTNHVNIPHAAAWTDGWMDVCRVHAGGCTGSAGGREFLRKSSADSYNRLVGKVLLEETLTLIMLLFLHLKVASPSGAGSVIAESTR